MPLLQKLVRKEDSLQKSVVVLWGGLLNQGAEKDWCRSSSDKEKTSASRGSIRRTSTRNSI